jgi:hypothetical protein
MNKNSIVLFNANTSKACIAVSPVNGNPAASSKNYFGFSN